MRDRVRREHKIGIIGSGNVGSISAFLLAAKNIVDDIVLLDIIPGLPQGKALDIMHAAPLLEFNSQVRGSNNYKDLEDSDVVVITAGSPRKPEMSREDLLEQNGRVVRKVVQEILKYAPEAIIIVVTNPLDLMTYLALKVSGFERERVLGMAGVLDSARCRFFLAQELKVSFNNTFALVLGEHGDSMLIPPRYSGVQGVSLDEFFPPGKIKELTEATKKSGSQIISYLQEGSASFAPAASLAYMVESIARNYKSLMTASVYLQGEYGLENLCLGVPVKLGSSGVEEILEIHLNVEERKALHLSAAQVKKGITALKKILKV